MEHLQKRLDFLNFVLEHSNLSLDIGQIDLIWEHAIEKPPYESENVIGFKWFEGLCSKRMVVHSRDTMHPINFPDQLRNY